MICGGKVSGEVCKRLLIVEVNTNDKAVKRFEIGFHKVRLTALKPTQLVQLEEVQTRIRQLWEESV